VGAAEADDDAPEGWVGRARRREGEAETKDAQATQKDAIRRPPPIHRHHACPLPVTSSNGYDRGTVYTIIDDAAAVSQL